MSSRNQPWAPEETVAMKKNPSTHPTTPRPTARLHHPQTHARTHTRTCGFLWDNNRKKNLSMRSAQKCGADQISVFLLFFFLGGGARREATLSRISKRHRRNRQVSRIHPEIRLNCAIGAQLWRRRGARAARTNTHARWQTPSCATPVP